MRHQQLKVSISVGLLPVDLHWMVWAALNLCSDEEVQFYGNNENMCCRHRFHVDKLSSAHVYLRMHKGQTMEMITPELLEDCAQLVKANSIQGLFYPTLASSSELSLYNVKVVAFVRNTSVNACAISLLRLSLMNT